MTLYTYYDHVPLHDHGNELKMLHLWRRHHIALGFQVACLQEYQAAKHPHYAEFCEAIDKLPSINPGRYDRACYLRWMAVAAMGGGVMMDYDTFLTPTVDDDVNPILYPDRPGALHVYQNCTPCLVKGPAEAFDRACVWFASFQKSDEKHLSDMVILEKIATAEPEAFVRYPYVKCYGETCWNTAPAVHFSNASMTPAEKTPRYAWIPKLLAEHSGGRERALRANLDPGFPALVA